MLYRLLIITLELGLSLCIFLPGFLVYFKDKQNRIHRLYFWISTMFGLRFLIDAINRVLLHEIILVSDILFRISDIALLIAGLLLAQFGTVFPRRVDSNNNSPQTKPEDHRPWYRDRVYMGFIIVALLLSMLCFTPLHVSQREFNPVSGTFYGALGPGYLANYLFFFFCVSWSIYKQYTFYRLYKQDPRREHARYFIISQAALVFTLFGLLILHLLIWKDQSIG